MLFVKVRKEKGEEARKKLLEAGVLDSSFLVEKGEHYIYFPVKEKIPGFEYVERPGRKRKEKPRNLKEALKGKFSDDELSQLITGFDIVGDIAIIQIPEELKDRAKEIAEAIMQVHKNVKVVYEKIGSRQGKFRLAPLKHLLGERRSITMYKENGVRMKVDVLKTYFSPRLSEERRRISELVRDGEVIAGLFAGVGPFPLVIAKKKKVKIYAVELNPFAYKLMLENIKLNKLKGEIIPILGDVKEVAKSLPKCDRVLMPLPKGGERFLLDAIKLAKPGGVIHFYQFAPEEDLYSDAKEKIEKATENLGRSFKILGKRVVGRFKPRVYQIVIDFQVF